MVGSSSSVELTGWIGSRIRSYPPAGKKPATVYLEIGIRTRPGGMGVDWFKAAGQGAVAAAIQKLGVRPGDKVSASGELSMRRGPSFCGRSHAYVVVQLDSLMMLCRLAHAVTESDESEQETVADRAWLRDFVESLGA